MPAIAELYATILPETSKIAEGITRAFREVDPKAREAGRRWGQEIQRGLGEAKVELKADTSKAKADIDEATRDKKSTVEVNADTAKARTEIDEVARNRTTHIRVDSDALVSSMSRSVEQMTPQLARVGVELGESMATSGTEAAPRVAGSLSAGMGPVGSALTTVLIGGAVTAAAGVAAALSGAIGLIPAGLAGGIGVIGTLVTGLDGVKDAWEAAGKAADSATKDGEEKAKAVASAQKTLRDAVLDEANAQKDVANARKDARQQLEDLNVQLRGGVIDEKSAILDAQAARRDLATGRYKDAIEYQQAQLRVQQADQRVLESHQRNVELQGKATEANQKGVEQNDQVVAANQRLAKAHDDVATAQKNLSDEQKKNSSNADSLAQAMAKLSPGAQAFIGTLQQMKPLWESLKFTVQDTLFAGIGQQLQSLATQYLPVLKTAMGGLAGTMNTAFKDLGNWLSQPQTMATIQQIVTNIGSAFQNWAQSIVPFSNAFLTITQVGSGFLPTLGKMITDGANAFNNFIQQASKSGQLQAWMHTGIEAVTQLLKMMPILGKMFLDLAPMAVPFLQTISKLLPIVEPLFSFLGKAVAGDLQIFNTFMSMATQWVDRLWGGVKKLGDIIAPVWNAVSGAIEKAWKIIEPILTKFKDFLIHLDPTGLLGKLADLVGKVHIPGVTTVDGTPTSAATGTPHASSTGPLVGGGGNFGAPSASHGLYGAADAGAAAGAANSAPSGFDWDKVAKAESGGNWSNADTGHNGHYGGLQFAPDTWAAYGGLAFASRPDLATPAQQKIIADRTAFTGWNGTPPQGLGAWETITNGSVPGVTTASTPASTPGISSIPAMPSVPGASAAIPGDGQSYGLPRGTNTGGYGSGGAGMFPQWILDLGAQFGVTPSTYSGHQESDRNEPGYAPNPQHLNRGVDWVGSRENMERFAKALIAYGGTEGSGGGLEQVIYQAGPGGTKYGLGGAGNVNPGYYPQSGDGSYDEHGGTDSGAHVHTRFSRNPFDGGIPGYNYPSAAGMPTAASPYGVGVDGTPLGTQQSPMYVQPAMSGGQQLGQDFISGIGEMFGIDGSVFKNPMDTGLFKGFKGLMGALTGGGKGGGGMPGWAYGASGGDGASLGGGGDLFGGLGSMLQGVMPQPFGQSTPGGPMQAPSDYQPMLPGSGGGTGLNFTTAAPGTNKAPGGTVNNGNTYVLNGTPPPGANDFVNGIDVPRARMSVQAPSLPGR